VSPILDIAGLRKSFGPVEALRGVDLQLYPGEVLAVVSSTRTITGFNTARSRTISERSRIASAACWTETSAPRMDLR
jgi:ABC-type phosphonate transport system ATPase subunit